MIKRKYLLAAGLAVVLALQCACGSAVSSTATESATTSVVDTTTISTDTSVSEDTVSEPVTETTASVVEEATEDTATESAVDKKYNYMTECSIFSTGNNERLKKVLERARSGETVNICTLGGSITEGAGATNMHDGYAYQFASKFEETYCINGNINFVNAGLSGTPSSLGVMRYQKDVIDQLGTCPDLLIIEFAVNDYAEVTNGRAYESLVYQALTDNPDCAVILLFSVSSQMWTSQNDMIPTGNYYGLPMVSMKRVFDNSKLSTDDYFYDEYHPSDYGHTLMCDCLMKLLEKIDEENTDEAFVIPDEAKKGRDFTDMQLIYDDTDGVKVKRGAFSATDSEVQQCGFKWTASFPDNYMRKAGDDNSPLKFELTCSHVLLNYKTSSSTSFGEADIYVDGKKVTTVNGYDSGGWNNCNVIMLIDEDTPSKHVIEIKMADGSLDKNFTVMGIAFN